MTNEKYTFVTDLREKKAAARGAAHRKCGSKSKRCTLPSDNLTPAQLKRRNSPVSTVKLNQPITYAEFKELSPSLKFLYVDHLIHEYKARRVDIVNMLGISQSLWTKIAPTIPGKLEFVGHKRTPAPEWLEFIGGKAEEIKPDFDDFDHKLYVGPFSKTPEPIPEPSPEPETGVDFKPLTVELPLIIRPPVLPDKVTFSLTGTPGQLVDLLPVFTKPDKQYRFELGLVLIDE